MTPPKYPASTSALITSSGDTTTPDALPRYTLTVPDGPPPPVGALGAPTATPESPSPSRSTVPATATPKPSIDIPVTVAAAPASSVVPLRPWKTYAADTPPSPPPPGAP